MTASSYTAALLESADLCDEMGAPEIAARLRSRAGCAPSPQPASVVCAACNGLRVYGPEACGNCGGVGEVPSPQPATAGDVERYVVQDKRQIVGNCVLWWAKDAKGYTCNLDEAHHYTEAEIRERRWRSTDIVRPLSKLTVIRHVRGDVRLPDEPEWVRHEGDALRASKGGEP